MADCLWFHSVVALPGRLYPSCTTFNKNSARKSVSDAEIKKKLAEDFDDISSENETDDEFMPSEGKGEIDEILPTFDISNEEAEEYQKNDWVNLTQKWEHSDYVLYRKKTESFMSNPQSHSEGRLRINNVVS